MALSGQKLFLPTPPHEGRLPVHYLGNFDYVVSIHAPA